MPFICDLYQPYQRKTQLEEIISPGLNSISETNHADSIHQVTLLVLAALIENLGTANFESVAAVARPEAAGFLGADSVQTYLLEPAQIAVDCTGFAVPVSKFLRTLHYTVALAYYRD